MGKASSSKKVARAARAGGSSRGRRNQWTFPAAIVAIIVVGVGLVVFARGSNQSAAAEAPTTNDHWHAAYGIYVCDRFLDPIPAEPQGADKLGIHTHGDGIMHVHPFGSGASGKKATFKVFGDTVGLQFHSDGITTPDGTDYRNGYDCNGQPAKVSVYQWKADDPSAAPKIYTGDFGSIRYTEDRLAFTIAVVPEGTDVPRPDSVAELDKLTDVPGATTPSVPASVTPSSVPGADASSTTAAPASTPSTAAP